MSNFKKFLEVQKINRQIHRLERGMYEEGSENNLWSPALGFGAYHRPSVTTRRPSEKEVLYRHSINKLVDKKHELKTR